MAGADDGPGDGLRAAELHPRGERRHAVLIGGRGEAWFADELSAELGAGTLGEVGDGFGVDTAVRWRPDILCIGCEYRVAVSFGVGIGGTITPDPQFDGPWAFASSGPRRHVRLLVQPDLRPRVDRARRARRRVGRRRLHRDHPAAMGLRDGRPRVLNRGCDNRRMWWLLGCVASGPLADNVYVWQRAWTPAVRAAVVRDGPSYDRLAVLIAEVDGPHTTAVDVPAGVIDRPVVAVLRVGAVSGDLAAIANAGIGQLPKPGPVSSSSRSTTTPAPRPSTPTGPGSGPFATRWRSR